MKIPKLANLVLLLLFLAFNATGQPLDYDKEYSTARANLEAGNYSIALNGFTKLMKSDPANPKSAYTSFYYAISANALGQKDEAKNMFLQVVKNYPHWDKLPETYLWLSKVYFDLSSPNQGIYYAAKINGDEPLELLASEIKRSNLVLLDEATLTLLLNEHKDSEIAEHLVLKMMEVAYEDRKYERIDSLISYYKLEALPPEIPDDVFREKYKIAVMLPLFNERLWASGVYIQKSLAVDLYKGIQLAASEFDSTKISVQVFDTKKDSTTTVTILENDQLEGVDAIIGPLYPKPINLVSQFASEKKINYLNPVSTNSQLLEKTPYAFLLRTGGKTIGTQMAEFVNGKFENKQCAIYYGPRLSDSLAAFNYAEQVLADSFHIVIMQKSRTGTARELFDSLTSSISVVDTVELQRMWDEGEKVQFMPMRDSLLLKVDTIGHIFIASNNKAIAAEVMAAITSRGDTTQIIGLGNWYSEANASLDIMEELGVWLVMQEFEDMLLPNNIRIRDHYVLENHKKPSKYFYYGYYAMKFIGNSLLKHGVYFQNGQKEELDDMDWFDYKGSQDNKKMMVIQLRNGVTNIVKNSNLE